MPSFHNRRSFWIFLVVQAKLGMTMMKMSKSSHARTDAERHGIYAGRPAGDAVHWTPDTCSTCILHWETALSAYEGSLLVGMFGHRGAWERIGLDLAKSSNHFGPGQKRPASDHCSHFPKQSDVLKRVRDPCHARTEYGQSATLRARYGESAGLSSYSAAITMLAGITTRRFAFITDSKTATR